VLKMGRTAHCAKNLSQLRDLSLFFDELANLRPDPKAPFVGQSAFAHKGGLHANAAQKVARSYEHIDPAWSATARACSSPTWPGAPASR
jgi:2-isopropylmalate synthase